jgi:hypothetical protein
VKTPGHDIEEGFIGPRQGLLSQPSPDCIRTNHQRIDRTENNDVGGHAVTNARELKEELGKEVTLPNPIGR